MATPVIQTVSSGAVAASTTPSFTLPASITAGDYLLILVAGAFNSSVTPPTGWTTQVNVKDGVGNNCQLLAFVRTADGTEGASVSPTLNSGSVTYYKAYRISGVDSVTPIASATNSDGNTATPNPPNLTPSWGFASDLWIAAAVAGSNLPTVSAYPTIYINTGTGATTSNTATLAYATRALTATSEDPGTFTWSSNFVSCSATIALHPTIVSFSVLDTVTTTEATTTARGKIFTVLENVTLTEIIITAKGKLFSILETITTSDTFTSAYKWLRQSKNSSSYSDQSKSSSSWTNTTKDSSGFNNQTKN